MSKYQCCGTTMMVVPIASAEGTPQILRICLFCDLRYIVIPEQRAASERVGQAPDRYVKYRKAIVLERPWSQRSELPTEPFAADDRFSRAG